VVALYENNQGLALITLAQFFFAAMSLSVKFLMESKLTATRRDPYSLCSDRNVHTHPHLCSHGHHRRMYMGNAADPG